MKPTIGSTAGFGAESNGASTPCLMAIDISGVLPPEYSGLYIRDCSAHDPHRFREHFLFLAADPRLHRMGRVQGRRMVGPVRYRAEGADASAVYCRRGADAANSHCVLVALAQFARGRLRSPVDA